MDEKYNCSLSLRWKHLVEVWLYEHFYKTHIEYIYGICFSLFNIRELKLVEINSIC